jgi:hypothetical protein
MLDSRPKRNYIRRKKCLKESASLVLSTLRFINSTLPAPRSIEEMDRLAAQHAATIEAVCWDPRTSKLTDSLYQKLMVSKTRELCAALICQSSPEARTMQVLRSLDLIPPVLAHPGAPMPHPVLRPIEFATMDPADEMPPNLEPFGEMPRMRFDGPDLFFETDDAMKRWATER